MLNSINRLKYCLAMTYLLFNILSFTAVADESLIYTVTTDENEISIVNTNRGVKYYFEADYYLENKGAPELPYKSVRLALPLNTTIKSVSAAGLNIEVLAQGVDHAWFEGDIKTGIYERYSPAPKNNEIYASSDLYPGRYVEIIDKGVMGSQPLATIAVYPIQYRPNNGKVFLIGEIEIHITLEENLSFSNNRMPVGAELLKGIVDNPEALNYTGFNRPHLGDGLPGDLILGTGAEYIIITSGELAPAFYPYAVWKNQKGLLTEMVLIEDILRQYTGEDPPAQLRAYLQDAYLAGAQWVLLGGDEDIIPIRYAYPGNVSSAPDLHSFQIADLYYADLTGNWDADGDGVYGEYNHDDPDIYPEVYVGRVATSDSTKAAIWVEKALVYEQNPGHGDNSYLTKGLFIVADQMRDLNEHTVLASLMPDHFIVDASRCAEEPSGSSQNPTQPSGGEVISVMDEGWGFISNLNHGGFYNYSARTPGYNEWPRSYVQGGYYNTDQGSSSLMMLAETDKYNIHYSISCYTAMFDFDKGVWLPGPFVTNETVMETYLFQPNKGGAAYLGNTRWGWVTSSYQIEQKFIEYVFSDTARHLAVAEALSKIYYPTKRDLCYGHNLFGDPETQIWVYQPQPLTVMVPDNIAVGTDNITIIVATPDGPAVNVNICLWKPGEMYIRGTTDEIGQFWTPINLAEAGELYVTATGVDLLPGIDTVNVYGPTGFDDDPILPKETYLCNNYPNPFNPVTHIRFALADPGQVKVAIYDISGRQVKTLVDDYYQSGTYSIMWDSRNDNGREVASVTYL